MRMNTSFPVHPTQIYESLVGLVLLVLLLWQRKVHAVPRAGVLPLRLRLRVPALRARALARRRRARQLRPDPRRPRLHPAVPRAPGARLRLRDLARHPERARANRGARARARASRRRVSRPQAGELRADRSVPALDEPDHRPLQRPGRLVLLRAVLGRRAQEPAAGDEPRRPGHHPRACAARPPRSPRPRGSGRRRGARDHRAAPTPNAREGKEEGGLGHEEMGRGVPRARRARHSDPHRPSARDRRAASASSRYAAATRADSGAAIARRARSRAISSSSRAVSAPARRSSRAPSCAPSVCGRP